MMNAKERSDVEMSGIQWAPLDVPLRRRLQTFWAFILSLIGSFSPFLSTFLMFYLLYTRLWWLMALYILFTFADGETASYGARKSPWLRRHSMWKYMAEYFPVKLVKTVELDPNKNYLATVYPHGLMMLAPCIAFETDALGFEETFPGLTSTIAHAGRFGFPFLRDFTLFCGGCSSSEQSLLYMLDKTKFKGNFVGLNTGGSAEVMALKKNEYNVIIKKRTGFARIALKTGASLVPVFAFGETRMFNAEAAPEGTFKRRFQEIVRKLTGIAPISPSGRGFFQYSFGIIPHRVPINVVVGAPIDVPQIYEPTKEDIARVQAQLMQAVVDLFEAHKHKYEPDPNIKLNIL